MAEKAYRQEIKQLLCPAKAFLLEQRIGAVLKKDTHSGNDGSYHIRSIYFDTLNDRAYSEKEAGISEREKIRIRFYDYRDDLIRLEIKEKKGKLIHKETLSISKATAEQMLQGNFGSLASYTHPLSDHVYAMAYSEGLHPAVVVDYDRRAYLYPVGEVRITFDSALQAGRSDIPVWNSGSVFNVLQDTVILEIKFNQYLPEHIRQLLCSVPGQKTALSKYTMCRRELLWKQGDFLGGKL